jgi:hypothetical protein
VRALAEFIMRGRVQAAVVAMLATGLPLVSPAAVALVTLRRGVGDGIHILLWALLPIIVLTVVASADPLTVLVGLSASFGYLVVVCAAISLRMTASWSNTLMVLVVLSSLASLLSAVLVQDTVQAVIHTVNDSLQKVAEQSKSNIAVQKFSQTSVLGVFSYIIAANAFCGLVLARWWQALLYNPGGFQAEFHQLRLHPIQAILSLVLSWLCLQGDMDYRSWLIVFALPLLSVAVAIVHYIVKALQLGKGWLVLFYLVAIMFSPLSILVLMVVAILDVWLNFRGRIQPRP